MKRSWVIRESTFEKIGAGTEIMSILRGQLKLVLQSLWQPVGWPSAQVEDLSVHPSICLSTHLPFYLSVSLSINHLSVYLFISVIYLWDKLSTCAPTELAPCSVYLKRSQQEWQMRSVCPRILKNYASRTTWRPNLSLESLDLESSMVKWVSAHFHC